MMSSNKPRYVGLDVHKHYVMVAAVNTDKRVVLPPRKVALVELAGWAKKQLGAKDEVVLEATTNAWYIHDLIEPLVARVVVVHPPHVKLIAASMVKTDKKDVLILARLLAVDMLPTVWVPPIEVRELRALIAHRRRLISQQTQIKNRLHSVLHRHQIVPPGGKLFSQDNRPWWHNLKLSASEALRVRQDWLILDQLAPLVKAVDDELRHLSVSPPWAETAPYLIQLPGIGLLTAMTILSAIGDIERFPSAKKLVGYAGLGARVHASGLTHYGGRITKQGRKELRRVLVEASWTAVRYNADWQARFERLERRIGKQKAIVAIARKLLVVIWHVLHKHEVDRKAEAEQVTSHFINWARQLRSPTRLGIKTATFARQKLDQLQLGQDLKQVKVGCTYTLPPSSLLSSEPTEVSETASRPEPSA
jgi:transposase